jgi:hypothetical protein
MRRVSIVALLVLVLVFAQTCQLLDSNENFDIPVSYEPSDSSYTVIYSTIGYELGATKHVVVRQNDPTAPTAGGLAFQWRLVDAASGDVVESGLAQFAGTSWAVPMWIADFSAVDRAGTYRMTLESTGVTLATEAFPVEDFLLSRRTFVPAGLEAAEARSAPIEMDNGYFEPHSLEGTSFAHAEFMLGLLAIYEDRKSSLSQDMRDRTKAAIDRAFDYLILLSDPATGQVAHAAPTRPYAFGDNPDDTIAGARGLARYAAVFQLEDPGRAERAYRRARLADDWSRANALEDYPSWARAEVAYNLYRYIGDLALLDRAVVAVREIASTYELTSMDRFSGDTMPHFETMLHLWESLADHPDRPLWERTAATVGAQYAEMVDRHPLAVVPPGVSHDGGPSAQDQWNTVETDPPPGDGDAAMFGNEWFMARAVDATYLAKMVDDPRLEQVATAHVLWIAGLNPGISVDRAPGDASASNVRAASFVYGLDAAAVMPAREWEWQRVRPSADIAGGFRRGLTFDDSLAAGGSSITRNGVWLQAIVAYEELIHVDLRPPTPEAPEPTAPTMRVASVAVGNSGEVYTATITVVDSGGTPLEDTTVSVVWIGSQAEGLAPEETILVDSCTTVAGGSCSVSLDSADAPGSAPVRLSVTSLEHERHLFVPGDGVLPSPTEFD